MNVLMEAATVSMTLSTLLTDATSVLTWVTTNIISVFNAITQSPIAMVFVYFAIIGVCVAFAKKLLHA